MKNIGGEMCELRLCQITLGWNCNCSQNHSSAVSERVDVIAKRSVANHAFNAYFLRRGAKQPPNRLQKAIHEIDRWHLGEQSAA